MLSRLFGKKESKPGDTSASTSVNSNSLEATLGKPETGQLISLDEGTIVLPIYVAKSFAYINVVDFQEALRNNLLRITTTGSIGGARIENNSDTSVYVPQGAVLRASDSGQQPRMTSIPVVVPPKQTVDVSANRCAQQSAGYSASSQLGQTDILYAFPTAAIAAIKGQQNLWDHIRDVADMLEIPPGHIQKDNLADIIQYMQSDALRASLSKSVAQLSFIPTTLGGKAQIHGQLIVCYDPSKSGGYTLFMSGFGNPQLWTANKQRTSTGIAAQSLVSGQAALRDRINLIQEVRQGELTHFVTAFYDGDINQPGAFRDFLPSGYGDVGIQVARMQDGTLVHYSAFSQKPK